MEEGLTKTGTIDGDYTIKFYNVDGFMNGHPFVVMHKGFMVTRWFYSLAKLLFAK